MIPSFGLFQTSKQCSSLPLESFGIYNQTEKCEDVNMTIN